MVFPKFLSSTTAMLPNLLRRLTYIRVHVQSLLSLRKQQAVACLAFSCDWLAHKLLKMCVAIRHHASGSAAADTQYPGSIGKPISPSRGRDSEPRSPAADGPVAPPQKLRHMARKLSHLADDSLLCLRLEVNDSCGRNIGSRKYLSTSYLFSCRDFVSK